MAPYRFLRNRAILMLNDENNTRVVYVRGNENSIDDEELNLNILFEENFEENKPSLEGNVNVASENVQHENGN